MQILSWIFRISLFVPFGICVYWQLSDQVGADPAKFLNHKMGQFALYYLTLNLLVGASISYAIRLPKALRFLLINRRWLGVTTFVYVIFHLLLYLTMESFEPKAFEQMVSKLYLILASCAFLLLFLLAITSNDFSLRKLGFKKWKQLHRMAYLATALITVHVMLIEKADLVFYGIFFGVLWLIELPRLRKFRIRH